MSAIFDTFIYNQTMKLEMVYRYSDKEEQLLDLNSAIITDEASLNAFITEMYTNSPTYTDRQQARNRTKHVIELDYLLDIIKYVFDVYGKDDLKIFFDYQNAFNTLKIFITTLNREKPIKSNAIKPMVLLSPNCELIRPSLYSMNIRLIYQSIVSRFEEDALSKRERAVAICVARHKRPISRRDVLSSLNYSERSITYALQSLCEKNLIQNVNKTNSSKLNRYRIIKHR